MIAPLITLTLREREQLRKPLFEYSQTKGEAAAGASKTMPEDFRVSITNAPGKNAYPVSSFTWLLIPASAKDPGKGKIITDFLSWMLDAGQSMTASLEYAPLPQAVVEKERAVIKQIH